MGVIAKRKIVSQRSQVVVVDAKGSKVSQVEVVGKDPD